MEKQKDVGGSNMAHLYVKSSCRSYSTIFGWMLHRGATSGLDGIGRYPGGVRLRTSENIVCGGPLSKLLSGGDTSTNSLSHRIPNLNLKARLNSSQLLVADD